MKSKCNVLAIAEVWCNNVKTNINSLYQIWNNTPTHQAQKSHCKGRRLTLDLKKPLLIMHVIAYVILTNISVVYDMGGI